MSVDEIKKFVLKEMDHDFEKVPTPSGYGKGVHLEVWEHRRRSMPLGLEMDRKKWVNLWLVRSDVPMDLPLSIVPIHKEPSDDGWTDDEGDGANHNLKHYRQFQARPITRLALKNMDEARQVMSQLTRSDTSTLTRIELAGKRDDGFLLKINGVLDAPKGICRPDTAADWEGGILSMPLKGKSASSRFDMSAGPVVERGAALYIWTHEGEEFGNGWGMTAKAVAGKVLVDDENLQIELTNVDRLPRPFGVDILTDKVDGGKLLAAMDANRHSRCWYMTPEDRGAINEVIETFGLLKAKAIADAEARNLSPKHLAMKEDIVAIKKAAEERRIALVKPRLGQPLFREQAMQRHNGRCVVTGYSVKEVLEAAHVIPHTGAAEFDVPDNSLVLRRDIHALFDAQLIAIHPKSGKLVCCPSIATSKYFKTLEGREIDHKLASESLEYQFKQFVTRTKANQPQ